MAKAKQTSSKKKKGVKTRSTEVVYHSTKEIKVERALIENFIGLQKVMVNLSAKFEALSSQISRLLDLFEISAKALVKREFSSTGDLEARRVMEKLENISRQAGLIGKGLALIHEVGTESGKPISHAGQALNQKGSYVQIPSSAGFSGSSSTRSGVPATGSFPQKMTRELGEIEKTTAKKDRKLGDDTNAGTNV